MPKVPTYDAFQVAPQVNPDVRVVAPEFQDFAGANAAKAGQAALSAGSAAARISADIINDANAVRIDEALNKVNETALALRYDKADGFENIRGEAALNRSSGKPLAVEYKEKLDAAIKENSVSLGNDTQRKLFALKANDVSIRFYAQANVHEVKQFTDYSLSVQEGTLKNAANAITLDPLNSENVKSNVAKINQAIYNAGKLKGMSAEQITATQTEAVSGTHMNAVKALIDQENTDGALAYFKEYKKDFNGIQFAEAEKLLNQADVAKVAITAANQLWDSNKPKTYNDPVDIFKMEDDARSMFANEPKKLAATISELRNRKAAFDSSQSEFNDANTNTVGQLMRSNKSLVEIQGSVAFNALPGKMQLEISQAITDRAYTLKLRSEHQVDRNYTLEERARHQREVKGMAQYFELSDPDVLVGMKRDAVAALWPKIGEGNTANLLQRWDSLQHKDNLITSRMDQEQFNAIAQQFDLKPFDSKKSTDEKAELGNLHNNINAKLEEAAKASRRPLTREEKETIMRTEMAKTVTVNGFFSNSTKPIVQLSDKDKAEVIVPKGDRQQIIEQMRLKYEQTKLPVFAPTEENVKFWYIQNKRGAK